MRLRRNTVGIVTSRASRLRGDDVFVVARKTLVGKDAGTAVTFVTKVVGHHVLDTEISQGKIAVQNRNVGGTVRSFRACATRSWSLVVVMAIGAVDLAPGGHRGNETWDETVLALSLNGMKGRIRGREIEPRIGLHELPRHPRRAT